MIVSQGLVKSNRDSIMSKRYIFNLPIHKWTMNELEERISAMKNSLEKYPTLNEGYKGKLAQLLVERTSRIGRNAKT